VEAGLLWFDDDKKKPLKAKVDDAVSAYCAKPRFVDKKPNTCYVHNSMLPEGKETLRLDGVWVKSVAAIPPYHFFIGVEDDGGNGDGRSKRRVPQN
jgi:hypothetical protein